MKIRLQEVKCAAIAVLMAGVALETAPSLTNEWKQVILQGADVTVDADGRIIIRHAAENPAQGFYLMDPNLPKNDKL